MWTSTRSGSSKPWTCSTHASSSEAARRSAEAVARLGDTDGIDIVVLYLDMVLLELLDEAPE